MNDGVKSAVRALRIMELFAGAERPLSLRDVVEALSLPKSSAHMLLATLQAEGYLEPAAGNCYAIPNELGAGWIGGSVGVIMRAAAPEMDRLLEMFQETVVLGVPTPSCDVRIVAHRQSPLAVRYDVSRDPNIPGWCTAMGHALLSHMPEEEVAAYLARTPRTPLTGKTITNAGEIMERLRRSRARGCGLNIDERFEGASGAAVAILDPAGRPRAALNVVTLTPRFRRRQRAIVDALKMSARAVERTVFHSPSPHLAASGD